MPRKPIINDSHDADSEREETTGAQDTQTDPQEAALAEAATGIRAGDGENAAESQTGTESSTDEPDLDSPVKNSDAPQTDMESEPDEGTIGSDTGTHAPDDDPNQATPQTDTENQEDGTGSAAQGALQPEITPDSQTELENQENDSGSQGPAIIQPDTPRVSQTETNLSENSSEFQGPGTSQHELPADTQTDPYDSENLAEGAKLAEENSDQPPEHQTDSESASQEPGAMSGEPKKTRKRSVKSQSGENADTPPEPAPATARRRRTRVEPVLAIDDERTVETSADKLRSDLLDLVESQKGKKILSGAIQGVERSADNPNISFAVIYHGAFKIIIPAEETVRPPDDFRDRSPADVMHYLVTKRLGAEVDYIVKGVDVKSGIAAASRLDAMALKRRQYYLGSDRDGNNLIYEGLTAEARVVSVIRAGIFVDLFGLEVYIALRELSYQRWIDAAMHFQPGQRVLVKILQLDRSDRNNIRVAASVKQAGDNPYEQALRKYSPGSRYVGTVSMVDTNGVFVSLDGGIDCLCSYPKRGRPPRGARVTVRIIGVNHENNRIWGAITHMTTAR